VDYHTILTEKMGQLSKYIHELADESHTKPFVDTGELMDVAVAKRAGLGFIGKNGLLVTKEFGSFVYLGEILTDIELPADEPVSYGCGECTRCVDNCPTSALLGEGHMNAKRCLSYQTQTKDMMPLEFRKKMRTVIYGCDICQLVCPYNKGMDFHLHEEMEGDVNLIEPELVPMLSISNKTFKEKFGEMAGSWRGKKTLQRNAIIALANSNDKTAIPVLKELALNDSRDVIVASAIYAVGRLVKSPDTTDWAWLDEVKQMAVGKKSEEINSELAQIEEIWS
jgi:epoxyqueuosine reductase